MSASTIPMPFLVPPPSAPRKQEGPPPSRPLSSKPHLVRRRPNQQQGRALEMLGHAIEYLVDSRMFLVHEPKMPAESDAVQVLSRASREVFHTCAEIVPMPQRLKLWAASRLGMTSLPPFGGASPRRV